MKHFSLKTMGAAVALALPLAAAGPAFAAEDIPNLSGVWQWGGCVGPDGKVGQGFGGGFTCMLLAEDDARLTERAKAYRDAFEEAAQPKYDCAPISIPHMWTDPYSHQIEQMDDRVIFTYGKDDVVRTVWLEGHGHPKPAVNEFFYFGYSTGRYEDGKLIVETSKFTFDPQGLNADFKLASTTQKKVTEVYSIVDDQLDLVVTTIDTFMLKEPWTYHVRSQRDEFPLSLPWGCDVEGSRDILKLAPSDYPNDPPIQRIEYP
ncbi:MAG: hypothetical protein ACO1PZ_12970 [Gammaproteobacteria bacterium]